MKKLLFLLAVLMQCFFIALASAEEQYPKENYSMYYKGYKQYPITFIQWGEGYVLDGYSATKVGDNPNILAADVHPVNMNNTQMSPKTIHIRVEYTPYESFKACLTSARGLGEPVSPVTTYSAKKLGASSAETGMLFHAGRMLWELVYNEPIFKNEAALKPIGEAGCPLFIHVGNGLRYSRIDPMHAVIMKNGISQEILFTPTYFMLQKYQSPDGSPINQYENLVGKMQAYASNADVALIKQYMGVPEP